MLPLLTKLYIFTLEVHNKYIVKAEKVSCGTGKIIVMCCLNVKDIKPY